MAWQGRALKAARKVPIAGRVAEAVAASALRERDVTHTWSARNDRDERHMRVALATALSPTSNVVDVGASSGTFLKEVVRLAPQGKHTAFEPRAEAAARLRVSYPLVDVRETAASDRDGQATFTVVPEIPELSGLSPRRWPHSPVTKSETTVRLERLDDVVKGDVSVLKIDVEGAEAECLRGGQTLLARCRPLVILEHGETIPGNPADSDHAEIWSSLRAAGLRVFDIDGAGPLSSNEFAKASASGLMWTFLARP